MSDSSKSFEKKTERLDVRLSHEKKQAFSEACENQGDTPSQAVRRFINSYIRRSSRDDLGVFFRRSGVKKTGFGITVLLGGICLGTWYISKSFAQIEKLKQRIEVQRELEITNAPIKSLKELETYLEFKNPSPLAPLSEQSRTMFLESLTFNEKGLTGFRYDVLEKELTPSEIYNILKLFGLQGGTGLLEKARTETEMDKQILESFVPEP